MGVAMLAKAYSTGEDVAGIAGRWVKPVARAEPRLRNFTIKNSKHIKSYILC